MNLEKLLRSVIFTERIPILDDEDEAEELTLCSECRDGLVYFMKNKEALQNRIQDMRLINRIRFLFKQPLQRNKEGW